MENIYLLLIVCLIFWYFIYLRKVAETARFHAQKYCEKEDLQFIAIARISNRLNFTKRSGLYWVTKFEFEFSGDGVSQYQGVITLDGYKLRDIFLPPYRF
ncbi:DUF3301 domain-containing protein [Thalassotalea piscium]|uniref:DUF3301 domain-containing protein n=1 Tax=Thalassotalea piscium TaxID=1230533 RepID=A0A7X0NI31_9GAMM|nr:DUF3301 domain-containing protein [Thalassotalea piscium]MBB6543897.1 hypothetical protein [Thalassotalea piscium]